MVVWVAKEFDHIMRWANYNNNCDVLSPITYDETQREHSMVEAIGGWTYPEKKLFKNILL